MPLPTLIGHQFYLPSSKAARLTALSTRQYSALKNLGNLLILKIIVQIKRQSALAALGSEADTCLWLRPAQYERKARAEGNAINKYHHHPVKYTRPK